MSASSSSNDLRNRILFTIGILAVYRFGTFVPLPGIDPEQLKTLMDGNQKGLLGMFNVFAGGAVSRMAIFALGIMPYISSSIIVQLLTGVSDYFKNLKSNDIINSELLKKLRLINKNSIKLKILGSGEIKSKINIEADLASKSAVEKLEKIGGTIQLKK